MVSQDQLWGREWRLIPWVLHSFGATRGRRVAQRPGLMPLYHLVPTVNGVSLGPRHLCGRVYPQRHSTEWDPAVSPALTKHRIPGFCCGCCPHFPLAESTSSWLWTESPKTNESRWKWKEVGIPLSPTNHSLTQRNPCSSFPSPPCALSTIPGIPTGMKLHSPKAVTVWHPIFIGHQLPLSHSPTAIRYPL